MSIQNVVSIPEIICEHAWSFSKEFPHRVCLNESDLTESKEKAEGTSTTCPDILQSFLVHLINMLMRLPWFVSNQARLVNAAGRAFRLDGGHCSSITTEHRRESSKRAMVANFSVTIWYHCRHWCKSCRCFRGADWTKFSHVHGAVRCSRRWRHITRIRCRGFQHWTTIQKMIEGLEY